VKTLTFCKMRLDMYVA